jgi:hypothetical protein
VQEPPYSLIEFAKELKEALDVLVTRRRSCDVDITRDTTPPAKSCSRDITMPALVVLPTDFRRLQLRDRPQRVGVHTRLLVLTNSCDWTVVGKI